MIADLLVVAHATGKVAEIFGPLLLLPLFVEWAIRRG